MPVTHTPRQAPVAAVMAYLLDQVEATAKAIEINSIDDGLPLNSATFCDWTARLNTIYCALDRASSFSSN